MANLLGYLQQDDFDVDCFVERIARQALSGEAPETGEDVRKLRHAFRETLQDLAKEYQYQEERAATFEKRCADAEGTFHQHIGEIIDEQKAACAKYKQSQKQLHHIVAKTSYLGDILEAHDIPRSRLLEAEHLIAQFQCLLSGDSGDHPNSQWMMGMNKDGGVSEHAQNVLALHLAASELSSSRYNDAKQKIAEEYTKVQDELLAELSRAQKSGHVERMREIVTQMSNFKGYGACVDQFIVNAQKKAFIHPDVFQDVMPVCTRIARVIHQVFRYPESVTSRLVDHILTVRVQDYIRNQLSQDNSDGQLYLARLAQLYTKTGQLCEELQTLPVDNATRNNLPKVPLELFRKYLSNYQEREVRCMTARLEALVQAYYQSVGHQRKSTAQSPLKDIRRGIQSKIAPKAATIINVAPSVKDFGGETFICEALAVNSLQELRESFARVSLILRQQQQRGHTMLELWKRFLAKFVRGHLLYGVSLGIKTIPVSQDLTHEPKQYFLRSVYQTNAIFHLVESIFTEEVLPILRESSSDLRGLQMKRECQAELEDAIQMGLKRSIKAYTGWIRVLLEKQRYSEFAEHRSTPTAMKVVAYVQKCIAAIEECLDGVNKERIMLEFGRRFHKVVLHNIRRFSYSQEAGIGLLCDINEYRLAVSLLQLDVLDQVFHKLQALCTLLVVPAENLFSILQDEGIDNLKLPVIKDFVLLRNDCKPNKLLSVLFHDGGP